MGKCLLYIRLVSRLFYVSFHVMKDNLKKGSVGNKKNPNKDPQVMPQSKIATDFSHKKEPVDNEDTKGIISYQLTILVQI